jgi:site-specific DNA recombinase
MPKKTPTETKKVAIYCRVSTSDQARGDFSSLKSQEDILRRYCQAPERSWAVYDVYADTKTGTNLEREELNRLLKDAADGKFDVLAATKLDRISRSVKDFLELAEKLNAFGIEIVVATQNIDTTTPAGKMQQTIMLAFAEFERDMISERTYEKLLSQAQKGYWGGGSAPLGYDAKDKKLVVNENESKIIQKIFQYYLETPSTAKVAQRLNSEGYRTKQRTSKAGKVSGGSLFSKESIKGILHSKVYIGIVRFNDQEFQGIHNPIITKEVYDKVQTRLEESVTDRMATYAAESPLTLLGITRCGNCGHQLSTSFTKSSSTGKVYHYYKCTKAMKTGKDSCNSRDLRATELERFVRALIAELGSDEEFFTAVIAQLGDNAGSELQFKADKFAELSYNLTIVRRELNSLVSKTAQIEDLSHSKAIASRIKELESHEHELEETIASLKHEIDQMKELSIDRKELQHIFQEFGTIYDRLPLEKQRRFNQALFPEIRSFLQRGEKDGDIEIKIRADGTLRYSWSQIVNPETSTSSFRGVWLRRQDSNLQPSG